MRFVLGLAALLTSLTAHAKASPAGESYVATSPSAVFDQPGGRSAVGLLEVGRTYQVEKHGGPDAAWCKLTIGRKSGWIPCHDASAPLAPKPAVTDAAKAANVGHARGCSSTCTHEPLFAEPPALTPADREILNLCPANPDAAVSATDVRKFFASHYDDPRLQRALSAAGRPGAKDANLAWLTDLWVGSGPRNAFTHVFCGDDWNTGKLGGLHYLPRFAALERDGRVCYGGPVKRAPVVGGQYLIRFRGVAPWSCADKSVGGFTVDHDPVAIVATGVRAFARCCSRNGQNEGGVFAADDLGGQAWQVWCGSRNGTYGIASFYPSGDKPTCGE
jgi:hypothetical protein